MVDGSIVGCRLIHLIFGVEQRKSSMFDGSMVDFYLIRQSVGVEQEKSSMG
jgi:hypothetical protein